MRSVTSCFNATIFKKNMLRFWPIWSLYTVIFLFAMPAQVMVANPYGEKTVEYAVEQAMWNFGRYIEQFIWLPLLFGVLAAMAVWSYLYTSRSACMVHAMPVRRESLFLTNYLSGLSMLVVPTVVVGLLTILAGACRGVFLPQPILAWGVAMVSSSVFFYSFASFCAMFTGNILALPAFYGILNVLVVGVGGLAQPILQSYLYGFSSYSDGARTLARILTPFWYLTYESPVTRTQVLQGSDWVYAYQLNSLVAYVYYLVAGIVIACLALLIYRRHATERAGDVVAVPWVHPLFRVGVGLCGGLAMGTFTWSILDLGNPEGPALLIMVIIWGVVAYFVAEMLLQKSFRVIRKSLRGAIFFVLFCLALLAAVIWDVTGYVGYVPQAADIAYASVRLSTEYDNESTVLLPGEGMDQLLALHQAVVSQGRRSEFDAPVAGEEALDGYFNVNYTLTDGSSVKRYYYDLYYFESEALLPNTVTSEMVALAQSMDFRRGITGISNLYREGMELMKVYDRWDWEEMDFTSSVELDRAERDLLWAAMEKDLAQGNLGQMDFFSVEEGQSAQYATRLGGTYRLNPLNLDDEELLEYSGADCGFTEAATNTIAALYELGVFTETIGPITYGEAEVYWEQMELGLDMPIEIYD